MKFDRVSVFSQPKPPGGFGLARGMVVIWFETGSDSVWLDWWMGDGPWILWEKGRSIGDCLKNPGATRGTEDF